MRHLLFIIVFLSNILMAGAQELRVKSFTPLPMDLTARKQQRLDLNGKPCAMLKIMVMDDITDCNKSNIGDIATSGVMKLVYLPSVVRSVTLNFKYHYPLTITFADYGVTKLEGSATYELRLVDALQMMMENGNAAQQTATVTTTTIPNVGNSQNANTAQQTAPVTTTQNVSSSQNNSLSMSAKEACKIADEAYKAKDYDKALKYYQYAAENNDSHAQFRLGYMYDMGKGVTQNYAEAMKWYLKAANQGHVSAQNNIGVMYEMGQGVKQDYAEAMKWYLKAANQGHVSAQNNIGVMYEIGKGVKQDYSEANKWYQKAAEQGYASAQYSLGVNLYFGKGITQNYTEAFNWLLKAAESGDAASQYNVGTMYQNGQGVKQDYSEALKWYTKASEQGHTSALYNLGLMYAEGTGMKSQNIAEALNCFYKAAQKGHEKSKAELEKYRKNGNIIGVVIDKDTNEPIIGCSVIVVKSDKTSSNVGTVSDINGFFSLNANVGDEIKVQYIGYKKRRVKILNDNPMIVYMFK